jgi:predicted Zn-dependent protease
LDDLELADRAALMKAGNTTKGSKPMRLLIAGFILCLCTGCAFNPITGEEELMLFPEKDDIAIGRRYAPEVEKQLGGRIQNESLQRYIDSVGRRIARVSHMPNLEYHFLAVDHESINALALPGGYLFITMGMLENLETEAQLASVLAHEVVHVVARDTMNTMSNEIGMGLLLSAAVMASDGDVPGEAVRAAHVAKQIISLRYSRKDESEADLGGLSYLVRAGYDPNGMVETMEILESQQKVNHVEFFSTHPSPENRIEYLTRRIQIKYPAISGLKVGREEYRRGVLEQLGGQSQRPPAPASD